MAKDALKLKRISHDVTRRASLAVFETAQRREGPQVMLTRPGDTPITRAGVRSLLQQALAALDASGEEEG